ncbi:MULTISPECIES: hypothetical protein [unclassified Streptomyces]|uniref:hypothetical protein n=1 Tax=unclassified Streptomyces TaxID=2593676 RepID=UPI0033F741EF
MRTRTTLACIGLAAAAFGPLAAAGPAVAAEPPPPAAPTAPAAPDAKILETVCASVQKIIEQIGAAQLVKVDALNPATVHDQCMKSGKVSMADPAKQPAQQPGALPGLGKAADPGADPGAVPGAGVVHLGGMDLGGVRLSPLTVGDAGPGKG